MKKLQKNIVVKLGIILLAVVFIAAGCSGNFLEDGGGSRIEDEVTDDGRLPLEDAELADHQPNHILLQGEIDDEVSARLEELGAEVVDDMQEFNLNIFKVRLPSGTALTDAIRELQDLAAVEHAEPNYEVERMSPELPRIEEGIAGLPDTGSAYQDHLWGLAAINAPAAWETATGEDVVVAIIDTGVQSSHPDLAGRVHAGFNVFDNNSSTEDWHSHGTHVAGTAAAAAGGGVVGVARDAEIMPIKVFHEEGYPTFTYETGRGIAWLTQWARQNDERVVANMSLGGGFYSNISKNAIDAGIEEGIVFVVSMGNSARTDSQYPARYDGVIAVGAIDGQYNHARFTTTGDWMSVTAPGENILSSEPEGWYGVKGGTSMSAPHVTGVAALLLSADPDLTPGEVKTILEETASVDELWLDADFSPEYGHGLVDAEAALAYDKELESLYKAEVNVFQYNIYAERYLPSYKSRVALYDDAGNFIKDSKTNKEGQAVFHNLAEGEYEVRVHQSFADEMQRVEARIEDGDVILLGHGYSYLTGTEEFEINEADANLGLKLESSALANVGVEIEGANLIPWLDGVDIIDEEGKAVFSNLHYPDYDLIWWAIGEDEINIVLDYLEDHPGDILLKPGNYRLEAELEPETIGEVELDKPLTLEAIDIKLEPGIRGATKFTELEKIPAGSGLFAAEINFIDEAENPVTEEDFVLEIVFEKEGEVVDTVVYEEIHDRFTVNLGHFALLVEAGEYDVTIQGGIVYDAEQPFKYRKVVYLEYSLTVEDGEVLFETLEIKLK